MEQPREISLHALFGWITYKKIRVMVRIGPYEVVVLIVSGSTHNFITKKMATSSISCAEIIPKRRN